MAFLNSQVSTSFLREHSERHLERLTLSIRPTPNAYDSSCCDDRPRHHRDFTQLCMARGRVAHASGGYSLLEDREKWAPPLTFGLEHRSGPPGPRKSNRFVRGPFSFCLCPLVADCHRSLIRRKIQSERSV